MRVISYYPLSGPFRAALEAEMGQSLEFTTVGHLRNLGVVSALRAIRALRSDHLVIAIENENARPIAGPLSLLGALSGSRTVTIVWPDRRQESISRLQALVLCGRLLKAQAVARWALRTAQAEASRLVREDPVYQTSVAHDAKAILYLDANLAFGVAAGGSLGHIKGVIDGFVGRGYDVDYASVRAMPTDKLGTRHLRMLPPSLFGFPSELNYYSFARDYERCVERWASERRYAFLYQRMSLHNFSGALLRMRLGLPLVLEFNGSEAWAAANWNRKLHLHDAAIAAEVAALRNADVIVTVSKVLAMQLWDMEIPPERIVTYPNCIDPAIFNPARFSADDNRVLRHRLGVSPDATVATFIGTFGTWHGVDFLASAIKTLIDTDLAWVERNKLHFLIVGDGLKMPEVRALLDQLPYRRYVTLPGLVPQQSAPAYLAASDIFLSPHMPNPDGTAFFGSPTKLFEYMAMARPIVASDLDQVGLVLRGEYLDSAPKAEPLGALHRPGDREDFLHAFRRTVEDPGWARNMAQRSRTAALAHYTWDHHVGAILERLSMLTTQKSQ
jgi:glycosyltransferase involved in cell wall biosynthesis